MEHEPPLIDLVRRALTRSIMQILAHEPGVRLGEDPEEVHQFRVGIRRLRADLHTFKALFTHEPLGELNDELAWLSSIIGAVRDKDVLAQRLRSDSATLDGTDRAGVRSLLSILAYQAATERVVMFTAMGSTRYLSLLDELIKFADAPPIRHKYRRQNDPEHFGAKFVNSPWRQLDNAVAELDTDPPDAALHHVRILAKRSRYAAEAVAPMIEHAAKFAKVLANLQTVLGDHQDAVVVEKWLREFGITTPQSALVAGELVFIQRLRQGNARSEWPAIWKTVTAEQLTSWL